MAPSTVTMGDPIVADLLSIPDPDATAFEHTNGVRRSMRTVKSRVLQPGFIEHSAPKEDEPIENVHLIATGAKSTSAKRLRSALDLHVKPDTSGRTEAPELLTPAESEVTSLESPSKKSKLTGTPTSSSTLTESTVKVREDESMAGESDEDYVLTELKNAGAPKTPKPQASPRLLATPSSPDESQTPSPKKRGVIAAKQPKRTARKVVIAKSPKTTYHMVDPVNESMVVRPPPHGKPLVWAEVCFVRLKIIFPHLAHSSTRVVKRCAKHCHIIEPIRVEHILMTTSALASYWTEIVGSELTWMRRSSSQERKLSL